MDVRCVAMDIFVIHGGNNLLAEEIGAEFSTAIHQLPSSFIDENRFSS
jgi:hypothetical protein